MYGSDDYNLYNEVEAEAYHDYLDQRDLFRDDYDYSYEDNSHYRALYMKPEPGNVDALLDVIVRIVNIDTYYSNHLPTIYVPSVAYDNDDLPF